MINEKTPSTQREEEMHQQSRFQHTAAPDTHERQNTSHTHTLLHPGTLPLSNTTMLHHLISTQHTHTRQHHYCTDSAERPCALKLRCVCAVPLLLWQQSRKEKKATCTHTRDRRHAKKWEKDVCTPRKNPERKKVTDRMCILCIHTVHRSVQK